MWSNKKLAKRYSEALFALAAEKKQLTEIAVLLKQICDDIWLKEKLRKVLCSPIAPKKIKNSFFLPLASALGEYPLMQSFCQLLAKNNRIHLLKEVTHCFNEALSAQRGELPVKLTSAVPFTKKQKDSLLQELKAIYQKEIKLTTEIDKDLLSGFKLRLASSELDFSMSAKLRKLRNILLKTQVNIPINNLY